MIDLETKFEVLEGEVKEINGNKETLKKNLLDLIELQYILLRTQGFFEEVRRIMNTTELIALLILSLSKHSLTHVCRLSRRCMGVLPLFSLHLLSLGLHHLVMRRLCWIPTRKTLNTRKRYQCQLSSRMHLLIYSVISLFSYNSLLL